MFRWWLVARGCVLLGVASLSSVSAQERDQRPRIDVQHYRIDAEIHPRTQSISARVQVRFVPQEDTSSAVFELNNGLNVTKVVGAKDEDINAVRYQQDFTVRLNFPAALPKDQPAVATFLYDGRLTGVDNSPVDGISFANIGNDHAFLLYPARWFPISGYTSDRFTAEMNITVPTGMDVIAPGLGTQSAGANGTTVFSFKYDHPSFPGSIGVVSTKPAPVASEGITTTFYFRRDEAPMAAPYGEAAGKIVKYYSGLFDLPPEANLTVVETDDNAPNGYAAPGILFLSPRGIGKRLNTRLLSLEIAHQWWGMLVSPTSRRHLWLENGFANYARLLYLENSAGPAVFEVEVKDTGVESLTHDEVSVIQADTLPDYSPELQAVTSAKGAMVLHMLRYVIGDDAFFKSVKQFAQKYAWGSATTADFEKIASAASGQSLQYFFVEWIESRGASEFKLEYTIFRLGNGKGFRVVGKVSQDKDTFKMPVELLIETEGEPEKKKIEVAGVASDFSVDTFGKPKKVILDPDHQVLRLDEGMRVAVAIKKGEQQVELGYYNEALQEYQKALDVNRNSSLAHYRIAEVFFLQGNFQSAANEFREAINGDQEPKWTEVWSHINLGKIFDITDQRDRAVNEYQQAIRTKDNTQGALDEANKYLQAPYKRRRPSEEA